MRFLIVDDHPLIRLGARHVLESGWPGCEVVEVETVADAHRSLQAAAFDAVLLDLQLPDAGGLESAARVLPLAAGAPVLVISQNDETTFAGRLLQLGVRGFLPKARAATELHRAVDQVLKGRRYLTPELTENLVERLERPAHASRLPHEGLSQQEFRVMQMIAAGHSPAHIAQALGLSVKTIGSYRARILQKTGWASNAELAKYCLQHGLADPA